MSGFTHAAVGANAVWFAALVGGVDQSFAVLLAAGAFAGLLPDIDAEYAKVHSLFKGLLRPFRIRGSGLWQHRGLAHSIFATAVVFLISFIFLRQYHPLLPYVIALGYFSHPFIDGFNCSVGYFFPFYNKRVTFWPRMLWSKVGGPLDQLFFFLAVISLIFFLLAYRTTILPAFGPHQQVLQETFQVEE